MRPARRTSDLGPVLLAALVLITTTACRDTFYVLKNRITPGIDNFLVFAADGQAGAGELWAGQAGGGAVFQLTYTLNDEELPALSPDGGVLAFVRAPTVKDSALRQVWFMNLVTGDEREVEPLADGAIPLRLAFSPDGTELFARTTRGLFRLHAPPATAAPERVTAADSLHADSILSVYLGEPPFALIASCRTEVGSLCAFPPGAPEAPLQAGGEDPVHWGADSIAYRVGDRLIVRSGAGGPPREVMWERLPPHPRHFTYAPAAAPR